METSTDAAFSSGASPDIVQVPAPAGADISARDAARSLVSFRLKAREGEEVSAEPAERPAEASVSAEAEPAPSADTPADGQADTAEAPDGGASEPPIEPPKSWNEDARERFKSLPRETQEFLARQEGERETELGRSQGEAAQQRAVLEAERVKAEQARATYENALPTLVATMHQQHLADFADVRSTADVERLAQENWPRYLLWDSQQKQIAGLQQQLAEAALRQGQDRELRFQNLVQREQALFIEKNPELADRGKRATLTEKAGEMLRELGFTDADLGDFFHGRRELNLHDHRVQMLIRDGVRYRDAQKAAKQASARLLPPVQRPGAAQARGTAHEAAVHSLTRRLEQSGNLKDAARLLAERRKAAR
jgi:hypothetical protein